MRKITLYFMAVFLVLFVQNINGQDVKKENQTTIKVLAETKEKIISKEKEALKKEVENINERLQRGIISEAEAVTLKEEAAKKRALNIENRIAIVDNKISLLERNEDEALVLTESIEDDDGIVKIDVNGERVWSFNSNDWHRNIKYDRRTYSDPVIAVGFSNAIIDGESFDDTPYKVGGSRFFEMGWSWRTRVFKNSNAVRFNYGFSFQFNGLKSKGNQYFVVENGQTELQEYDFDLKKSKFRMDNLVFPVHFEFGPSKFIQSEDRIRYSLRNQFRFGIGGYAGFNMSSRQKLKYIREGEKVKDVLKGGYNTSELIYGLSAYIGFGGIQLYAKYDLNPIFLDATVEQRMVAMGLRFDLN